MKTIVVALIMLALASGCATSPNSTEPSNPVEEANEMWVRNRELYYRNSGWSSVDATYQAAQDFEAGKVPPADRPPIDHRMPH